MFVVKLRVQSCEILTMTGPKMCSVFAIMCRDILPHEILTLEYLRNKIRRIDTYVYVVGRQAAMVVLCHIRFVNNIERSSFLLLNS
jgi:hypothetical protein